MRQAKSHNDEGRMIPPRRERFNDEIQTRK
jgi:hypothetical protein